VIAMMARWLIAAALTFATAQAQSLRVVPVTIRTNDAFPKAIQFFCAHGYSHKDCKEDVARLRRELARYPVDQLGQWSFVLVPSGAWKDLTLSLGGDPDSPAFSVIERRSTVLESAMFSSSAGRKAELFRKFGFTGDALLSLAVTHELGHAICNDTNERRADDYGRDLRNGNSSFCPAERK
jgi:hypothetical protein